MRALEKKLREHLNSDCFLKKLKKGKINIPIKQKPSPLLIIDMDCACVEKMLAGQKKCDFLLFARGKYNTICAYGIEVKKRLHAHEMIAQLQSIADYLDRSCLDCARFIPIVAAAKNRHKKERTILSKSKIRFRGKKGMPVYYWSTRNPSLDLSSADQQTQSM